MKTHWTIGAVVFDQDTQIYRKADPRFDGFDNTIEWAVYENGSFCDVYASKAEALRVVKELRE